MTFPFHAETPEALKDAAAELAAGLQKGSVLALDGDLGAGKTTFVQGLMKGLGFNEPVTSPTFTLVNDYPGGRLPAWHFDFYRIETEGELDRLGWDDYLEREGLVIVEWASRFPHLLPGDTLALRLSQEGNGRKVEEKFLK